MDPEVQEVPWEDRKAWAHLRLVPCKPLALHPGITLLDGGERLWMHRTDYD